MSTRTKWIVRPAAIGEIGVIREVIAESATVLGAAHYSPELIGAALQTVLGVDTRLIRDGTYFLATRGDVVAGCGGWSPRRTLFGSDAASGRDDGLLDPATDAARIRAFFVRPGLARQGIGSRILERCERAARNAGFRRLELGATLSGTAFYLAHGFTPGVAFDYECRPGMTMEIVPMSKDLMRLS